MVRGVLHDRVAGVSPLAVYVFACWTHVHVQFRLLLFEMLAFPFHETLRKFRAEKIFIPECIMTKLPLFCFFSFLFW